MVVDSYPYMKLAKKWNLPYRDVLLYSDSLAYRIENRVVAAEAVERVQEVLTSLTIEFEEDMYAVSMNNR